MPVAIGLQHATLNWEDPSCHCGPARHTEHRESQLIEEDDEGQEDDDEGGEGGEGEEGGEESDIKSNNPHLTGGEKYKTYSWSFGLGLPNFDHAARAGLSLPSNAKLGQNGSRAVPIA